MTEHNFSYSTRIGNTTFIVNVKQSESAKKPLDTVFRDICRHEALSGLFIAGSLISESQKKSS